MIKLDNNKVLLSSREHTTENDKQNSMGLIKQRIVSANSKIDSKSKTPESLERDQEMDYHRTVGDNDIKCSEQIPAKSTKLELSKRHRRSFSDGNDLMQFKFNHVQNQVQYSKNLSKEGMHVKPAFHQIVGLEYVSKSGNLLEESINTNNPPPSTH